MNDLEIITEFRDFFLDRREIRQRISRAKYQALLDAGRFTRRTARMDILRRRKKPARAGQAPSVHSRDRFATLRNILYFISSDYNTVIIGPRRIRTRGNAATLNPVPQTLEKGGAAAIRQKRRVGDRRWRRMQPGEKKKRGFEYRRKRARYRSHPFMTPALEQEAPKFPHLLNVEA